MHFDAAIISTLGGYWDSVFGGIRLQYLPWGRAAQAIPWIIGIALLGFLIHKLRRGELLAGLFAFWFFVFLAPVLPLREHFTEYYLTLPTIGVAMLGAWAFASSWKAGKWWRFTGVAIAVIYIGTSIPISRSITSWSYQRTQRARKLVLGVGRAHQLHPGKTILLSGVDSELFWAAVTDRPFPLVGVNEVYLVPEAGSQIEAHTELAEISDYVIPQGPMLNALSAEVAVVYDVSGEKLRNITKQYSATAKTRFKPEPARRVDVGKSMFSGQIGAGWYQIEDGYRWMPKRASLSLGGPRSASEKLYITGYCPAAQVEQGPVNLTVFVAGEPLSTVKLKDGDARFDFSFPLPEKLLGSESIEVSLSVDRSFSAPGDPRELGAAFGVFAIR